MSTTTETDVLIVGAGPVGLLLANECARRGLRWRLVETHPSQSGQSKALAIFPRTLEILDMAGVVGPFLEVANRVTSVAIVANGRRLAHMPFTPPDTPYPFIAMVPQDVTERLLAAQLRRRGGEVEYETSFVTAVQRDDRVRVVLERRGERSELSAAFVVGCDGAHSTVRHLLNLPFAGAEYDSSFMLADVDTNDVLPADQLQLCPSAFGPVAIFPMSATRRRIVATIERAAGGAAPTLEVVRQVLRQRAPGGIEVRALHWSSYFRVHRRHAARLRVGRMFIAGDAAHIHSPFGGQGMNTGMHDVWNLVWKLDLVLRGRGNDTLLESYGAERLPVIERVIETTDRLTRVMGAPSALAQTLRDAIIPIVSRLAPFQHAFVQRLSGFDITYGGSAIIEGDGKRYFDDTLRGGQGIRDRFVLLCGAEEEAATSAVVRELAGPLSDLVEVRPGPQPGFTLVRPDGYVAYAARGDAAAAVHAVRSLVEGLTRGAVRPMQADSVAPRPAHR